MSTICGARAATLELLGDHESVDVGELNVEQYQVGRELRGLLERAATVYGLADNDEALGLEQMPGTGAKGPVIVND